MVSPRTRSVVRRQALQSMCLGADGKLTKNAMLVLAYLRRFCNGDGTRGGFPLRADGAVDALGMARIAGRREVYDDIVKLLAVPLEVQRNIEEGI